MKPREKEFCRLMAVCGEPERAARMAGYKHPAERWPRLLCREDIAAQISRDASTLRAVVADTAASGLYRMLFSQHSDALRLLYHEELTDEELDAMDLTSIAEIKRTKDKSVEIKFFDRIKAVDKLNEILNSDKELNSAGSLIDAIRLSAQSLGQLSDAEGDFDGV